MKPLFLLALISIGTANISLGNEASFTDLISCDSLGGYQVSCRLESSTLHQSDEGYLLFGKRDLHSKFTIDYSFECDPGGAFPSGIQVRGDSYVSPQFVISQSGSFSFEGHGPLYLFDSKPNVLKQLYFPSCSLSVQVKAVLSDQSLAVLAAKVSEIQDFVTTTNATLDSRKKNLAQLQGMVTSQAANEYGVACTIKRNENNIFASTVVTELKTHYLLIFSKVYDSNEWNCDEPISLATELATCQDSNESPLCQVYGVYLDYRRLFEEDLKLVEQHTETLKETNEDLLKSELENIGDIIEGALSDSEIIAN